MLLDLLMAVGLGRLALQSYQGLADRPIPFGGIIVYEIHQRSREEMRI